MSADYNFVEEKLAEMFALEPPNEYSQRWEHEIAVDPPKLSGVIQKFEQSDLDPFERSIMMEVIIGSLSEALDAEPKQASLAENWERVSKILHSDFDTYGRLINYWKRSHVDPQHRFAISKYLQAEFPDETT